MLLDLLYTSLRKKEQKYGKKTSALFLDHVLTDYIVQASCLKQTKVVYSNQFYM